MVMRCLVSQLSSFGGLRCGRQLGAFGAGQNSWQEIHDAEERQGESDVTVESASSKRDGLSEAVNQASQGSRIQIHAFVRQAPDTDVADDEKRNRCEQTIPTVTSLQLQDAVREQPGRKGNQQAEPCWPNDRTTKNRQSTHGRKVMHRPFDKPKSNGQHSGYSHKDDGRLFHNPVEFRHRIF